MDIRDQGFGLNFSQGFGQRMGPSGSTGMLEGMADAGQNFRQGKQLKNNRDLQGAQNAADLQRAQIAANASMFPAQLAQGRFDQLFPLIQGQFGGGANVGNFNQNAGPEITAAPVWNQNQIQRQVNSQRATSDQQTGTANRGIQQQLAGRGFSSNSPLLQALQGQQTAAGLARGTGLEQGIRWDSAQGNASQLLNSQQARAQQSLGEEQQATERYRAQNQNRSQLLALLAGIR